MTLLGHRIPIFIYSSLLDHKLFNVFQIDFSLSFNCILFLKKSLAPPPLHHSYCSSLFKQTHRTHFFLIAPSYLGPGNKALTQGTPHLPQEELSPVKKQEGSNPLHHNSGRQDSAERTMEIRQTPNFSSEQLAVSS